MPMASMVAYARKAGMPIFMEKLDFRQKKAFLEGENRRYCRMLSSFRYARVRACFLSRGIRQVVEVYQVNPAFSSSDRPGRVQGTMRAQRPPGGSIGPGPTFPRLFRRHPMPTDLVLSGNGVRVAFTVPVRKRVKHVWTLWGCVLGQLRPVLAAHRGLGRRRRQPNPVRAPA